MRHLLSTRLARRVTWARDGELTPRFGGKKLNRQVRRAITRDTRRAVEHAHAEIWEDRLDAFMEALFDASPVRYADPLTYGQRTRTGAYVASVVVAEGWHDLGVPMLDEIERLDGLYYRTENPEHDAAREAVAARYDRLTRAYDDRVGYLFQHEFALEAA